MRSTSIHAFSPKNWQRIPNLGPVLTSLARISQAAGRLEEAESRLRRVLSVYEQSIGVMHPAFAKTLCHLKRL